MAKKNYGILGFNPEKEINFNPYGSKSKSKKKEKCPPHLKPVIRNQWWGVDTLNGECFCCGRKLHYDDAEVGHIQASSKGGKWAPENCRLICRKPCNAGMGNTNMKVYMKNTYHNRYEKFFGRDKMEKPKRAKSVSVKTKTVKPKTPKSDNPFRTPTYEEIMK